MADFIVETGAGVEGANSYAALDFVRSYLDARGQLSSWDGTAVVTEITAVNATDDTAEVDYDFVTGDGPVQIALTGAGALPGGLTAATDYWLVVDEDGLVQFATSYANATAETPTTINLTTAGSGDLALSHPDFNAQRAALVRATDYIEQHYGERLIGERSLATQGLHFPADGAWRMVVGVWTEIEGVPEEMTRAVAELALRARSTGSLTPDGAAVTSESRSKGGVSRSVTYAVPTVSGQVTYQTVARLIAPLVRRTIVERF